MNLSEQLTNLATRHANDIVAMTNKSGQELPVTLMPIRCDGNKIENHDSCVQPDKEEFLRYKDMIIPVLLAQSECQIMAMVAEAWTSQEAVDIEKKPSECADRKEILLWTFYDASAMPMGGVIFELKRNKKGHRAIVNTVSTFNDDIEILHRDDLCKDGKTVH